MPVQITFTCAWCGQTAHHDVTDFTTTTAPSPRPAIERTAFPRDWQRGFMRPPTWFDDEDESPPPLWGTEVFCSPEHSQAAHDAIKEVGDSAWKAGQALASKLYREQLRRHVLSAKGAVTALGELGEEAEMQTGMQASVSLPTEA